MFGVAGGTGLAGSAMAEAATVASGEVAAAAVAVVAIVAVVASASVDTKMLTARIERRICLPLLARTPHGLWPAATLLCRSRRRCRKGRITGICNLLVSGSRPAVNDRVRRSKGSDREEKNGSGGCRPGGGSVCVAHQQPDAAHRRQHDQNGAGRDNHRDDHTGRKHSDTG